MNQITSCRWLRTIMNTLMAVVILMGRKVRKFLGARILAVADAFDLITSKQLHATESWEYKSAIKEIIKDAESSLYDPEVANTLNTLFDM
ncbi:MAG: hypothetical protein QGI90_06130 [Nitrospinaceae bacterium]|nr:hypothetical protein [Nitrospinaceae bacterium]MDP7148251.1 hypothetical protein [Nitrospinaceae bacterium]